VGPLFPGYLFVEMWDLIVGWAQELA